MPVDLYILYMAEILKIRFSDTRKVEAFVYELFERKMLSTMILYQIVTQKYSIFIILYAL